MNNGDMIMGTLTPDTEYVYERVGGAIYAREFGADPATRKLIGYDYQYEQKRDLMFGISRQDLLEMADIIRISYNNTALAQALEEVRLLYKLAQDHNSEREVPTDVDLTT